MIMWLSGTLLVLAVTEFVQQDLDSVIIHIVIAMLYGDH